MGKTQTSVKFVPWTVDPTKGNVLSAWDADTGSLVVFSGRDGDTVCWVVSVNESSNPITVGPNTIQPGDWFTGYQDSAAPLETSSVETAPECRPGLVLGTSTQSGHRRRHNHPPTRSRQQRSA